MLDAIRQSNVVSGEAGGITQHIGAYQIDHNGQKITFIDTPGHAAFSQMRARGSQLTDIVVLVVAANDGVKPQTLESIKHIKAAGVPHIVAINKIDVVGASPDMVKAQLTEHEIFTEGYGGNVPVVNISALKKEGIDDLLENILVLSELEEIETDENGDFEAVVVETQQDKHKGILATVIVKNGTVTVGDVIYTQDDQLKVRAMHDENGKKMDKAVPGQPTELMGFKSVPAVGSSITTKPQQQEKQESTEAKPSNAEIMPEDEEKPTFDIILKADTEGTLEAITTNLADEAVILSSGVGPINESDILHAQTTGASLLAFHTGITSAAKRLARVEEVPYRTFDIIYELFEYIEKRVLKLLEPTIDEEELGVAEVLATFEIRKENVIGCKVTSGELDPKYPLHWIRGEETLGDLKIKSLRQGKRHCHQSKTLVMSVVLFLQETLDLR